MAKQHFVKKARKPIYRVGKLVTKYKKDKDGNKQPYSDYDTSQPFTNSHGKETDSLIVAVGESYYWCKFKYQKRKIKKTPFTSDELRYGKYGKPEYQSNLDDYNSQKENS